MIRRSDFDVPLPGRKKKLKKKPSNTKFTPDQVRNIRTAFGLGKSQHQLAREYGVSQPAISYIVRGLRWADIQ